MKCIKCGHDLTVDKTDFFESHICENCFEYSNIIHYAGCCKNPETHNVKFITSAGTIQVREQCKKCGSMKGSALGGFTQTQKDLLPLADLSKKELSQTRTTDAYRALFEYRQKGREALINEQRDQWFEEYSNYLQSPAWKSKRALVLKRDNYLCQCCLVNRAQQVHHKSYEFVDLSGSEPCFDLVSVCVPCHEKIEEMKSNNRQRSL